ncbi:MAG: hypothetical protein ACFFD4_11565 [Candidatus Odinarchaeota archaeon]
MIAVENDYLANKAINRKILIITAYVLITGYVVRVLSEIIHELGHGLATVIFGGRIEGVHISLITPLDISMIDLDKSGFTFEQDMITVAAGLILCLSLSFCLQFVLLVKKLDWRIAVPALWLAYWCYSTNTGIILDGVFGNPGDMTGLIEAGVMTPLLALITGVMLYFIGLFFISTIVRRMLRPVTGEKTRFLVVIFWINVPLNIALYILKTGYLFAIIIGLIPVVVSYLLEFHLIERLEKLPNSHPVHKLI